MNLPNTKTKIGTVEARLRHVLGRRASTLLAIGPMSKNCVDATIELAYKYPAPLLLIASRRQIEAAELGGGYVNQWSTEAFVRYVRDHDPKRKVVLARDHGGPWQNTEEVAKNMSAAAAMASAKRSYDTDIAVGLDILHLDPSIDPHQDQPSPNVILERLFELYEHCMQAAKEQGKRIIIEVGTEEQSGQLQTVKELEVFLSNIQEYCAAHNFPQPFFVVVQTGTKVKELRNVGSLGSQQPVKTEKSATDRIAQLVETCQRFGVHMKEHNADYLPDETLRLHPRLGIHASNVAPEFGVAETRKIIELCDRFALKREKDDFLGLAYESHKWEKWLTENSTATDFDKAIIAGHYVFSHPSFIAVKERLAVQCAAHSIALDQVLRQTIVQAITRYMTAFNLK